MPESQVQSEDQSELVLIIFVLFTPNQFLLPFNRVSGTFPCPGLQAHGHTLGLGNVQGRAVVLAEVLCSVGQFSGLKCSEV